MKVALLTLLALALGCAADPVLLPDSGPCSSVCGAGTVCMGGACVAVDAGPMDVGSVDSGSVDSGSVDSGQVVDDRNALPDFGPRDTGVDAGSAMDVQQAMDTGSDAGVDVDPRQSEVCQGVTALCDGRIVNVQIGSRDGGVTYHCGGCGITCAAGEFCINCVCQR